VNEEFPECVGYPMNPSLTLRREAL